MGIIGTATLQTAMLAAAMLAATTLQTAIFAAALVFSVQTTIYEGLCEHDVSERGL